MSNLIASNYSTAYNKHSLLIAYIISARIYTVPSAL